ncbi:uncharacterized protein [Palaemon carinicauda]|uniref:uncharacterized protein n=1 Tax=Palaemon carinicauda TaxID=392227 RepID=UPI0035B67E9C
MLTILQIRTLLPLEAYTVSIDLTDAYWHLPIDRCFSPYLGFSLERKGYVFRAMPFGLNRAPRIFMKLIDTVVQQLREKGLQVSVYLDDWLVWAPSALDCSEAATRVVRFLQSLRFQINFKKSRLAPAQHFQWLGIRWNLKSHSPSIPPSKRKEIVKAVRSLIKSGTITRRRQERVLGSLQFASVTNPVLKVRLKEASRIWKRRTSKALHDHQKQSPVLLRKQLQLWSIAKSLSQTVLLRFPPPVVTDTSYGRLVGWLGGHTPLKKVQGHWSQKFKQFHINILEAMAVFLSLKKLHLKENIHIRLVLDSKVIVHCIYRQGSRSPKINHVMIAVFTLAQKKGSSPWTLSGSVYDESQQETSLPCSTKRGSSSSGNGHDDPGLESLDEDLPVPTIQPPHEGYGQASIFQRDGGSGGSSVAKEQLVFHGHRIEPQVGAVAQPDSVPGGTVGDCLRFIMENEKPSSHDFFDLAIEKKFQIQCDKLEFAENYKLSSTMTQYETSWKKWVKYVKDKNPGSITIDFCLGFLIDLHAQGLAASMISSYKSALTRPILYAFDVDFNSDLFNKIPKACARLRPSAPPKPISWSLDKVSQFASDIDTQTASIPDLTQKIIFLIAMASSARVSEIVALSRDEDHIELVDNGEDNLKPDPAFLAKNELPSKRWGPWKIVPLPGKPSLCLVQCLKVYLLRTVQFKGGQLSKGETVGSDLFLKQLRAKITYFIQRADPASMPLDHDPRKVAFSLSFFHYMSFEGLQAYTG